MTGSGDDGAATAGALADRAARLLLSASPVLLAAAEELHAAHEAAMAVPEAFARSSAGAAELAERSVRAELAVALRVSEHDVARRLVVARLLVEELPSTRAALAQGQMLWEAAAMICAAAATLPSAVLPEFDERAVEAAGLLTPTQLRRAVARLREELHPEPLTARHARAREDRSVWVRSEIDGMATLCAMLPAVAAMGAYARIDRIARDVRGEATGDSVAGDGRTLAQLRADALTDLLVDGEIALGEDADATFAPGVRPEVRITLAATTAAGLDDASAHLDGYGPVPADVARELVAVGASFTRVLTDPATGAVVSVGRTHRVPPSQMRLHLQLRDQTCRFPGCTRPAAGSEADHILEWRNGGATSLDNLASLCVAHHHVRHGDRWNYTLRADGTVEWTTPSGRRVIGAAPVLPGRPPSPPRAAVDEPPPR